MIKFCCAFLNQSVYYLCCVFKKENCFSFIITYCSDNRLLYGWIGRVYVTYLMIFRQPVLGKHFRRVGVHLWVCKGSSETVWCFWSTRCVASPYKVNGKYCNTIHTDKQKIDERAEITDRWRDKGYRQTDKGRKEEKVTWKDGRKDWRKKRGGDGGGRNERRGEKGD